MLPADLFEHDPCRTSATVGYIAEALTDRLEYIGAGGQVQQALIGSRVLHDGLGFALDSKNYRPFALLELFHKLAGPAPERRQRLNVFGYVEHGRVLLYE